MDALRKSVVEEKQPTTKSKKGRKRITGQREMLRPILGAKSKEKAKSVAQVGAKQEKAG